MNTLLDNSTYSRACRRECTWNAEENALLAGKEVGDLYLVAWIVLEEINIWKLGTDLICRE